MRALGHVYRFPGAVRVEVRPHSWERLGSGTALCRACGSRAALPPGARPSVAWHESSGIPEDCGEALAALVMGS